METTKNVTVEQILLIKPCPEDDSCVYIEEHISPSKDSYLRYGPVPKLLQDIVVKKLQDKFAEDMALSLNSVIVDLSKFL